MELKQLREHIRAVADFPREDVQFYDIAPLLGSGALLREVVQELAEPLRGQVDKVVGFDARGFLFAGAMAVQLGTGCAMLRKPGKLPGDTYRSSYELEYGSDALEIQADAVQPGERIVLVDDVVATGGTALAGIELVRQCGGEVAEFCSVIDLPDLGGSERIRAAGVALRSLVQFGTEE